MSEQEIKQQRVDKGLEHLEIVLDNLRNATRYLTSLENIENDYDMEYFNRLYKDIDNELTIIGGGL